MKFTFFTKNIDKRVFKRTFRSILSAQLPRLTRIRYAIQLVNYSIIIKPSTLSSQDPFFYGKNGIGGFTDRSKMVLYLNDKDESWNDSSKIFPTYRANTQVVSHEQGHLIGLMQNLSQKVPLRNTDESNTRKGTLLNYWTAEVHDRDIENKSFWHEQYVTTSLGRVVKMDIKILDFKDFAR